MRKSIGLLVAIAVAIALPLAAQAGSGGVAIVQCAQNGSAVVVVAVSEGTGLPAIAPGSDCATALATLGGVGLKVANVVSTGESWTYTLSRSSGQSSSGH